MSAPDFWDDNEKAQKIISQLNLAKETYSTIHALEEGVADIEVALELYDESEDADILAEAEGQVAQVQADLDAYEMKLLLSGPHDANNAFWKFTQGLAGPNPRTGAACSCVCTSVGRISKASR